MSGSPRLGVTLFSYTREYYARRYTLADCLAEAGKLEDARALELIGAQSLRGYPRPAPAVEAELRGLIEYHGLEPTCYGAYLERGRRRDRVATIDEAVELIEAEIAIAKRLGFPLVRLNTATPDLLEKLLPTAEAADITIAVELHQKTIESPEMQALLELFERAASPRLGFVQDLGAMMTRIPDSFLDEGLRSGIEPATVRAVAEAWPHGTGLDAAGDGDPAARGWAAAARSMFLRTEPATLRAVLPHLAHVHGKFFGIDASGQEPCIPYGEILAILRDGGYAGAIASEYLTFKPLTELDSAQQVRAHHQMIRRLWQTGPERRNLHQTHEEATVAN